MIGHPEVDLAVLAPLGIVALGAVSILVANAFLSRSDTLLGRPLTIAYSGALFAFVSMSFLSVSLFVVVVSFASGESAAFQTLEPLFQQDPFGSFVTALVLLSAILACALSVAQLSALGIRQGEYYALLLLSTAGAILQIGAVDLLTVFLGLELMSLPLYVLAGFERSKLRSNEASLKFFVTGAFASAGMLYGMALLYGATGATAYPEIRSGFDLSNPFAVTGLGLVLAGFAARIAVAPFHQWAPDVQDGAPTPAAVFIATVARVAALAALLRFVASAIGPDILQLSSVFWGLAVLGVVVGNAMALVQQDVKRMLAYATVAQAGYLLAGLSVGSEHGHAAVLFQLVVYVFSVVGAYAVVIALARDADGHAQVGDFAGLSRSRPGLAALLTLFLASLAGVPGTAGFIGKFQIIAASVEVGMVWVPVVVALGSLVSVFYCVQIPIAMYMKPREGETPARTIASGEILAVSLCALVVVWLGFLPDGGSPPGLAIEIPVLEWAGESVKQFFGV